MNESLMSSADLAIKDATAAVSTMDSKQLFSGTIDKFTELVWMEREKRLRGWVAEGWTQMQIAQETGRSRARISEWMTRLGVQPLVPHRTNLSGADKSVSKATNASGETCDSTALEVTRITTTCPTCNGTGVVPVDDLKELLRNG